ncbi:Mediator of RNA polymerase II transcription subunit 21 [Geodia barretti]|uniref:Mediator of RNA polymerase II transcription subunit 21 n=1 Tax=Geodia barretti TaxID=519541 RepID=A0AA35R9Y7_GEOBA|nr:Mediator of RNA polymerase II transcription subunit 21 [Geodia barretti]
MADRLTQLQEAVNQLGEYFCSSVGVLQGAPEPAQQNGENPTDGTTREPGSEPTVPSSAENAALFASLISRTAQDIDVLIESLPSQAYTPKKQVESLQRLQSENQLAAEKLRKAVEKGEVLLEKIREALKEICDSQFGIENDTPPR